MTQEKEKERVKPEKQGDDGPVEEPGSSQAGEGTGAGDNLSEEAKKIDEDIEKYRRRSREKFAKVEAEDTQPRQKYKQHGGE